MTVEVPGARKYLTPVTHVTTSLEPNRHYAVENLENYDRSKYLRTAKPPKKGDYVLYTFEEPVECHRITVQTADPVNNFYGITVGHVEVSYDGINFQPVGRFDMYNKVVIEAPAQPVKAVKIVVDGPGEDKNVSIQSLMIE